MTYRDGEVCHCVSSVEHESCCGRLHLHARVSHVKLLGLQSDQYRLTRVQMVLFSNSIRYLWSE